MSILSAIGTALGGASSLGLTQPFNTAMGYAVNAIWPFQLPPIEQAYDAFRRGTLSAVSLKVLSRLFGVMLGDTDAYGADGNAPWAPANAIPGPANYWGQVLDGRVNQISIGDLISMKLRGWLPEGDFKKRAQAMGWWRGDYLDEALRIATNLTPGPADLVRFALRDCWDEAAVTRWQYDADFPAPFDYWMKTQGAGGSALTADQFNAGARPVTWSQMFWRAHWNTLSPTQSYEMFQRLRPSRVARFASTIPGLQPFTFPDLQSQLQINDYPPPVRPQLAAIAYRKPRLVDIDRWFKTGSINSAEALELHLDIGYSPADAQMRVDWLKTQVNPISTRTTTQALVRSIAGLYEQGEYAYAQAIDMVVASLSQGKFQTWQAAATAGANDQSAGQIANQGTQIITLSTYQMELASARKLTQAWRNRYLRGVQNRADISVDMLAAGRTQDWVKQTLDDWDTVLAGGRLLVSAGKIKKLWKEQIITTGTAKRYLSNLGYRDPELSWLIADLPHK